MPALIILEKALFVLPTFVCHISVSGRRIFLFTYAVFTAIRLTFCVVASSAGFCLFVFLFGRRTFNKGGGTTRRPIQKPLFVPLRHLPASNRLCTWCASRFNNVTLSWASSALSTPNCLFLET